MFDRERCSRRGATARRRDRAMAMGFRVAALAAFASCTPRVPRVAPPTYAYAISPPAAGSWRVTVEATFEGAPGDRLVAPESADSIRDLALVAVGSVATSLGRDGHGWLAPACRARCTIRYTVDLEALAASCHRVDCDRRVGDAVIGRASSFLVRPAPTGEAIVRLRTVGPAADRFVTGLRRDGHGGYIFAARELGEASFTAFGGFRRTTVNVSDAGGAAQTRINIALLGAPIAMGDRSATSFIEKSASCVAALFGRFPVETTVFVVPVPGASEVVFGRVMSLAGASVVLLFGDATRASSVQDNWVVVHEFLHLGTPSFAGEGHWLEEGLATYYEPILRERAGWMTEADLWSHFVREMPRGLREPGLPVDLEDREDIDSTYWGGAIFALLADVRIRASPGDHSLDDVVRAALDREGDATHAALVSDFLRVGEDATGTRDLRVVYETWALKGENPDLDALWRRLGITGVAETRTSGTPVVLRDDAPLATVRKAIAARAAFAPH